MMKKHYFILTMLFFVFQLNAQTEVTVDTNNPIFGFANVFETPANGGGYVFGSPWGLPDLKTVVDSPEPNDITLQPNFNTWNPADPFWVINGEANKWFEGNTYFEDNSLVGQPFSFVGGCLDYTIDPVYDVVAFIKVFNGDYSVLKLETTNLVAGENFEVTYTNVEPEDAVVQYGFWVFGPIADPANEPILGSVIVSSPIPNDICGVATPSLTCGQTLSGDTSNDTDTNGDGSPDEWFSVTSSIVDEIIIVSTCNQADFDTILTVYDSCGGAVVAFNDDAPGCSGFTSELSFQGDGSSTYYIAVDGFGGGSGTFDLTVSCALPPSNDECSNAIEVDCNTSVSGTTVNATIDTDTAPDCDTPVTSPGVWYVYEDTTGLVTDITVTMCSGNGTADYDSKISVYTGDCGAPPLTCVVGNDDTCGLQSEVTFQSDGATTYYILVHGFGGSTGNFTIDINCVPVPPPNDMIANSIDVDEIGFPYTDPSVAMPAATTEDGTPEGCDNAGVKGVWYNFVPEGNGTATASITTPSEGSTLFTVNNGPLAGDYVAVAANFGGAIPTDPLTEDTALVLDDDTTGDENDACDPIVNGASLSGKIAVVRRGACEFGFKALSAQNEGAVAVIVVNNQPGDPIAMGGGANGGDVTIPAVMVSDVDGEAIIAELESGNTVNVSISSTPAGFSHVSFYTAPNENAVETDLVLVEYFDNQCVPSIDASIPTVAGQAYYVYVANGVITDIVIDGTNLGISDNEIEGFEYYPNPADETINLSALDNIEYVELYNILGQKVIDLSVDAISTQVNVSNLSSGAYIMKVIVGGQTGTYKIIKR
jgi:hypothetical protein